MKEFLRITVFVYSLFLIISCAKEDAVGGINTGKIDIINTTLNEIQVASMQNIEVKLDLHPRDGFVESDYNKILFSSSDEGIFEVNNNGIITGRKNGKAILVVAASSNDGSENTTQVKGSCVVSVSGQVFVEGIVTEIDKIKIDITKTDHYKIEADAFNVIPKDALIRDVIFISSNPQIATVDNNGLIKAVSGGETVISILSTDGSNIKADIKLTVIAPINTWYLEERRSFVFDYRDGLILHPLNSDGTGYGDKWEYLIDDGDKWRDSFISLTKPGKNGVPDSNDEIFIPIDMQKELKFNQIFFRHRSTNTLSRLRVWAFDVLGSNDGESFIFLENVPIPGAQSDGAANVEATMLLEGTYQYRYIKIRPSLWNTSSGNTMQISDVKIGYDESTDPKFEN